MLDWNQNYQNCFYFFSWAPAQGNTCSRETTYIAGCENTLCSIDLPCTLGFLFDTSLESLPFPFSLSSNASSLFWLLYWNVLEYTYILEQHAQMLIIIYTGLCNRKYVLHYLFLLASSNRLCFCPFLKKVCTGTFISGARSCSDLETKGNRHSNLMFLKNISRHSLFLAV